MNRIGEPFRSARLRFLLLVLIAFPFAVPLSGQPDEPVSGEGPRWFGTTGRVTPFDTAGRKELTGRALESAGLLEGAIDPTKYPVGPNDGLTVTVWTTQTKFYDVLITPDAKALIPTVGEVNLRGKTLAEAEKAIQKAVSRVYSTESSVSLRKMREFKVNVIGAVRFPMAVTATPTTRVSEAIDLAGGASQKGNKREIVIIRRSDSGTKQEIPVDLLPFYAFADLDANPYVRDGDVVKVNFVDNEKIVQLYGEVVSPGEFPWREGDSISTILNASFGLTVDARRDSVEVVSVTEQGEISSRTWHTILPDGTVTGDRLLQNGDRIFVRRKASFLERSQVVVDGEVRQPGIYPIIPGTTRLRELLTAAGGFTDKSSLLDAVLIRRNSIGQEDPYLVYILAIESENRTPEESAYLRTKLIEGRNQGRMVVDFIALMEGDESQNFPLINNDSLYVPERVDYIQLMGKVKNSGNFIYRPGLGYEEYIALAGGYGWKAEKDDVQVIKGRSGDRFPAEDTENYMLEPGDAIFIPEESPGNFWEGMATALTIVTQTAALVALVLSLTERSQ